MYIYIHTYSYTIPVFVALEHQKDNSLRHGHALLRVEAKGRTEELQRTGRRLRPAGKWAEILGRVEGK